VPRQQVGVERSGARVVTSGGPATIDIVIGSGVETVELDCSNLQPSTGSAVLRLQVSTTAGVSWLTGASEYVVLTTLQVGASPTDYTLADSAVIISRLQAGVAISKAKISVTLAPRALGLFHSLGYNSGTVETRTGGFYAQTATPINGLRLLWDTAATFADGGAVTALLVRS